MTTLQGVRVADHPMKDGQSFLGAETRTATASHR